MKILVSDPNSKIGLAVIRSLNTDKHHIEMFSNQNKPMCYYSNYCKKINLLPPYDNHNFEKKFISLLKSQKFDYVIPVQYKSFYHLSKMKKKILKYSKINCENFNKISKVSSKVFMRNLSQKINISYLKDIKTFEINNLKSVKKKLKNVKYPIVIKPKLELGGRSKYIFYAYNEFQSLDIVNKISKKYNLNIKNFIIQTKIGGTGRGFFCNAYKGKCISFFQHERIREFPITGGISVAAKSIYDKKLTKIGKSIVKKLKWDGVLMLEFKYYKKKYYLIEANPKFWGSLDLATEAGANFPLDLIKKHNVTSKKNSYRIGLKYHWPFDGDLNISLKNFKFFFKFLIDCINPFCKSNVWLIKDPIISFYQIYKFLKYFINYAKK